MKSPMGNSERQHMMHGGNIMDNSMMSMGNPDPIEWEDGMKMMNKNSTTDSLKWELIDEQTGKMNDNINWKFITTLTQCIQCNILSIFMGRNSLC